MAEKEDQQNFIPHNTDFKTHWSAAKLLCLMVAAWFALTILLSVVLSMVTSKIVNPVDVGHGVAWAVTWVAISLVAGFGADHWHQKKDKSDD